jgi:hypothetical protein
MKGALPPPEDTFPTVLSEGHSVFRSRAAAERVVLALGYEAVRMAYGRIYYVDGHDVVEFDLNDKSVGVCPKEDGTVWRYAHDGGTQTDDNSRNRVNRQELGEELWTEICAAWRRNCGGMRSTLGMHYEEAQEWHKLDRGEAPRLSGAVYAQGGSPLLRLPRPHLLGLGQAS